MSWKEKDSEKKKRVAFIYIAKHEIWGVYLDCTSSYHCGTLLYTFLGI